MQDYEKLGLFYLGRTYDLNAKKSREELLLYDSKDLTTHAMCVGMTGSGKTGLCIGLLEEAAIDGIPALIIDPKGDLSNLLLTFPELRGKSFRPWINEDEARKKNLSPDEFAAKQAELWSNGLQSWGQSGERIRKLRESADFAIYTPGSTAGLPISILQSFSAPQKSLREDADALRERITTTATSLLGLLGIDADPIKSREHILISTILDHAWNQGRDLDLAGLIQAIQSPPVAKIGVFDLDSFFPSKERFELAMSLNNLLAAPGFQAWLEGEPLDIDRFLYTAEGKPRLSIFSIAHLSDAERMFFVSLLLNQTLGWMRTQSGTTSLRALLYMDEIFGYMPPVANPPSKAPLLTLLKQARAFGLGVVLATQNPVDLDYKGLSNIGTWFLGRLQTERDKARVLEGLEGAAVSNQGKFDRQAMEQTLAGLGKRIFLMNNVHEDAPVIFETRWVLSYLSGPLTRNQIKSLMGARQPEATITPAVAAKEAVPQAGSATPPPVPPDVKQFFLPVRSRTPEGAKLFYKPFVLGAAKLHFDDRRKGIDMQRAVMRLSPVTAEAVPVKWEEAFDSDIEETELAKSGESQASYGTLPAVAHQAKNYREWEKDFADDLYRSERLELFKSPSLKVTSEPKETERDFRLRLVQLSREQRDEWTSKLREKYAKKMASLESKVQRAEDKLEREQAQASQQKLQTMISVGSTLLGAVLGRKAMSRTTISKASTAMRGAGRAMSEAQDVDRAREALEQLQQQMVELDKELQAEIEDYTLANDPLTETLETVEVRLKKTNISVQLLALAWVPHWLAQDGTLKRA